MGLFNYKCNLPKEKQDSGLLVGCSEWYMSSSALLLHIKSSHPNWCSGRINSHSSGSSRSHNYTINLKAGKEYDVKGSTQHKKLAFEYNPLMR